MPTASLTARFGRVLLMQGIFLDKPFSGATFDSRKVEPGMLFVALKGEKVDGHDFIPMTLARGAAGIVDGCEELARAARDYRRSLKAQVIGITGSAGKTTTKELVRAFLGRVGKVHATEGNFNNHIGLPITILNCPPDADFLVLEMGTNHPGEIASLCDIALPDAGLVTCVGTAHIEFFGTQEAIAREKGTLLARAKGPCVVSAENPYLPILRELAGGRLVAASTHLPWLEDAMAAILPGAHNLANASLAYALCAQYGLERAAALAALDDFALPGARWRRTEKDGVFYIDDTYNANPDSMMAAIATFAALPAGGRRVAILGDMFELGPRSEEFHREVFDFAAGRGLDLVVAVGSVSSRCRADLAFASLEELLPQIGNILRRGDTVLLKASHGMRLGRVLD